ncbi:unnamed protein product [Orchesella dallaii]|uniref:Nuclear speckle splicing regulatory protein 1 N-terminal domain-containing protein n=1 Tax=Orchesella dallaii TaxID=48710 RepID=A0ABP1RGX4_9HEXA
MAEPNRMAQMKYGSMQQRQATQTMKKALEEDPTAFQYDELYDEMDKKRTDQRAQSKCDRKPKYIAELMKTAERRQRENERRIEKQAQKDIEKEGDLYKDKEAFVTGAYKRKMEELRRLEEEEKRKDALDDMVEVTQQKDLSGFYRHIYRQTMKEETSGLEKGSKETSPSTNAKTEKTIINVEKTESIDHQECPEHEKRGRSGHRFKQISNWKSKSEKSGQDENLRPPASFASVAKVGEFQDSGLPTKLSEHPVWKRRTVGEALEHARVRYLDRSKCGEIVPIVFSEK